MHICAHAHSRLGALPPQGYLPSRPQTREPFARSLLQSQNRRYASRSLHSITHIECKLNYIVLLIGDDRLFSAWRPIRFIADNAPHQFYTTCCHVADFGLSARFKQAAGPIFHTSIVGTPLYLAPEVLRDIDTQHYVYT